MLNEGIDNVGDTSNSSTWDVIENTNDTSNENSELLKLKKVLGITDTQIQELSEANINFSKVEDNGVILFNRSGWNDLDVHVDKWVIYDERNNIEIEFDSANTSDLVEKLKLASETLKNPKENSNKASTDSEVLSARLEEIGLDAEQIRKLKNANIVLKKIEANGVLLFNRKWFNDFEVDFDKWLIVDQGNKVEFSFEANNVESLFTEILKANIKLGHKETKAEKREKELILLKRYIWVYSGKFSRIKRKSDWV